MSEFKNVISFLGRSLGDHPEHVQTTEEVSEKFNTVILKVHRHDLGKVIGRQGRMAKAMRTILKAGASRFNKQCHLKIMD